MANRLLRDGICTSDAINDLTPEEEVLFYRLLVVADDFGHADGRPAIIKASCFPLKDTATIKAITSWLDGLERKGLVGRYESGGKPYIAVLKWESRVRSNPKYPQPSEEDQKRFVSLCQQPADNGQTYVGVGLGKGLGKGASNANDVRFDAVSGGWSVPDVLKDQWAKAYPAVDLEKELSAASVWLLSNPKNAKSNYARFLGNWFGRAQDKAPRVSGGPRQDPAQVSFV